MCRKLQLIATQWQLSRAVMGDYMGLRSVYMFVERMVNSMGSGSGSILVYIDMLYESRAAKMAVEPNKILDFWIWFGNTMEYSSTPKPT